MDGAEPPAPRARGAPASLCAALERSRDVVVLGVEYGAAATLRAAVPADSADLLPAVLAELTGGTATARPAGTAWVDAG